jgi:lipopolysaccharide export system permease protein
MNRIARYVLAEFLFSFLVSFLFFFFIFFVNQLLVMAEEIFSKKVPFWDVVLFVLYSLPAILALAVPFGALLGALMAVGRFSSDNELLAMRACGLPLRRVLLPLLAMGLVLSLVSFAFNDYFLPLGNLRLGGMYRKILYSNPSIELEPYSVKAYRDAVLITGAVEGQQIRDLAIIDKNDQNQKRVITAARGRLSEEEGQRGVISIRLEDVFSHARSASDPQRYEYSTARTMIYNILLRDISAGFINPTPREMRAVDVWRKIQELAQSQAAARREQVREADKALLEMAGAGRYLRDGGGQLSAAGLEGARRAYERYLAVSRKRVTDRNLQLHELEFHKKFSIPFSCLVFVLFAFPAGMLARRSGRAVGFGLGLLVSALYWGMLFVGHTLGIRLQFSPLAAMWLPNAVILAAGGALLAWRRPG